MTNNMIVTRSGTNTTRIRGWAILSLMGKLMDEDAIDQLNSKDLSW